MSRLEEAKQGLEEALARLEEKTASLTPSSESAAMGQALSQSQAENQRLKSVAEGLDKRLDAVIARLAVEAERMEPDDQEAEGASDDEDDLDEDQ